MLCLSPDVEFANRRKILLKASVPKLIRAQRIYDINYHCTFKYPILLYTAQIRCILFPIAVQTRKLKFIEVDVHL